MPRVSVIIPSYNHEKYVAEAIQSVLDQTYQDFEIVITDDGSSDNTVEVIKSFTDPRIRLFCLPKNRGACVAANHCIKESKGEFIALLNSDDVFVPEKLEKQVNFLDLHFDIGAVFSYAQFIDDESNVFSQDKNIYYQNFIQSNKNRFEWLNYFFFNGNCLCHPSILIRKECYGAVGRYDQRLAQLPDLEFWIRLCQKYEIFIIPEKLVKFRLRNNEANVSGNKPEMRKRIYVEYPQVLQQYLKPEVLDNFSKIFPEISKYSLPEKYDINKKTASLLIAKLALTSNIAAVKYFGINTLYKLFEYDDYFIEELRENYQFDFIDLIKITGSYEIFSDPDTLSVSNLIKSSKIWRLWKKWQQIKQFIFENKH
jgi:glycosyltransferase involved in cell wall biosynthesis